MKATINGIVVEGTAEEIAKLVREFGLSSTTIGSTTLGNTINTPYTPPPYTPSPISPIFTTPTPPNLVTKPYANDTLSHQSYNAASHVPTNGSAL